MDCPVCNPKWNNLNYSTLVPVPNMFKSFTFIQPNGILGDFYFPSYLFCPSTSPGDYGEGTYGA